MKHLVVTVHGIRTFGGWQERLEGLLKAETTEELEVFHYKYGYFSIIAFLIPIVRWLVVRRFRREFVRRSQLARWDRIDIVAHSFGTHLVGWGLYGLPKTERPRIHTIVMAGSVLKPSFPWLDLIGSSITRVINDCGTRDRILILNQVVVLFTGMAGRVGFAGMTGNTFRNRFFAFGHSGYFIEEKGANGDFMKSKWIPLLLRELPVPIFPDPRRASAVSGLLAFVLNNLEPLKLATYLIPFVALFLFYRALYVSAVNERDRANRARKDAIVAAEETKARASKAEYEVAVRLASERNEAVAYAHVVRALELDNNNVMASLLAYRLLSDGALRPPYELIHFSSLVRAMVFSPDGKFIGIGCSDGSLLVQDLETRESFHTETSSRASIRNLAFSPRGDAIAVATGSEGGAKASVQTWQYRLERDLHLVSEKFAWDDFELTWILPDRIVVNNGRDWGTGGRKTDIFTKGIRGWELAFGIGEWFTRNDHPEFSSIEEKKFVLTGFVDSWVVDGGRTLVLHDREAHRLLWLDLNGRLDIEKPKFSVKTEDGDIVDVAINNGIAIVGASFTDRWKYRFRRDRSAGAATQKRGLLQWTDPRNRKRGTVQLESDLLVDRISDDGEKIICMGPGTLSIRSRSTGDILASGKPEENDPENLLAVSKNGQSLVARMGENRIALSEMGASFGSRGLSLPSKIIEAQLDPSGRWLVVSSDDMIVRIWPLSALRKQAGSIRTSEAADMSKRSSTVGASFYVRSEDGQYIVFRRKGGAETSERMSILRAPDGKDGEDSDSNTDITGYAASPDGARIVVTYGSKSYRPDNNAPAAAIIYETVTGRMIGQPLHHDDSAFSPCYAPDGTWFLTVSNDRSVRRWDAKTGALIGNPLQLPTKCRFARISPDGGLIVTGSGHVIDVRKWRIIRVLTPQPPAVSSVFFSHDQLWLATISESFGEAQPFIPQRLELNQWDLQNGVQISKAITVGIDEGDFEDFYDWDEFPARWHEEGRVVAFGKSHRWECGLQFNVPTLIRFLQECRSLVVTEAGEQLVNDQCSLNSVTTQEFFPMGRTEQNHMAYDFVEGVLN